MVPAPKASPKTTSAKIAPAELTSALRARIMNGQLVPNQRLIEVDIAEEFGASRGNVRLALAELTMEGLVDRVQNRGAKVRGVTPEEAVEITEIRSAIESMCTAKAAKRVTPEQAEELRGIGKRLSDAVEAGDLEAYAAENSALHNTLIQIAGMPIAAETIARLRSQSVRQQFQRARLLSDQNESLSQHLSIIDAVCAGDAARARAAMEEHLSSVSTVIAHTGITPVSIPRN